MLLAAGNNFMLGNSLPGRLLSAPVLPQFVARSTGNHRRGAPVRTMAAQLGYEAWVKGDPKNQVLGDCEFCPPLQLSS